MASNEIPYKPLIAAIREIRVLIIQPGLWSDDADWIDEDATGDGLQPHNYLLDSDIVRCTLKTVSLDDNPSYEALSYVWGDANERAWIVVDETWTTVTVNLQRALRRLRNANEERVLWADALCINQCDIAERGQQVGIMGDIYSACSTCMVWLGEEEDYPLKPYPLYSDLLSFGYHQFEIDAFEEYLESQGQATNVPPIKRNIDLNPHAESWLDIEAGFDLAKMLGEDTNRHLFDMPFYEITEFPHFTISRNWQNAWHSLLNILGERPWWRRTWTVQEAVLPPSTVVQLGDHQLKFEILLLAALVFESHNMTCCDETHGYLWDIDSRSSDGTTLDHMFERLNEMRDIYMMDSEIADSHFERLYYLSRNREATDHRDSIFGMVGMFPNLLGGEDGPDYNKSTAVVYSEATRRMIEDRQDLYFLTYALSKARQDLHLPSWVLDWGISEFGFPGRRREACGPFSKFEPLDSPPSAMILPIESQNIGTVSRAGKPLEKNESVHDILIDWKDLAPVADVDFWRTVFDDSAALGITPLEPMLEYDLKIVFQWWQWVNTPGSEQSSMSWSTMSDIKTTNDFMKVSSRLRIKCLVDEGIVRYFITDLGGPGMARAGIEVGDQIHIAKGCMYPIILRPLREMMDGVTEKIILDTYQLVSCCYLHGFMDGEGVKDDVEWRKVYLR